MGRAASKLALRWREILLALKTGVLVASQIDFDYVHILKTNELKDPIFMSVSTYLA